MHFGAGAFSHRGNVTITILDVNAWTGQIRLQYDVSFVTTFPSVTTRGEVIAANVDDSNPNFKYSGTLAVPPYTNSWSMHSIVTLDGRNTIKVEGDRADLVIEYGYGNFGGRPWVLNWWNTNFPIGYPTSIFIDAATKPGDTVHTYLIRPWQPKIQDYRFSFNFTRDFTSALGTRPALVLDTKTTVPAIQGAWQIYSTSYYDKESGIFLAKESSGKVTDYPNNETNESENVYVKLVEVAPLNLFAKPSSHETRFALYLIPPIVKCSLMLLSVWGLSFLAVKNRLPRLATKTKRDGP
jgi:hypothetical protein